MSAGQDRVPVRVQEATGQSRNFLYAMWVCDGYNPCDSVFWGLMKTKPPSDRAWVICSPWIVEKLGDIVLVPSNFCN